MRRFNSINERLVFASENKTNQVLDSFETNKMGITNERATGAGTNEGDTDLMNLT